MTELDLTNPFAALDGMEDVPEDPFAPPLGTNVYTFTRFSSWSKGKDRANGLNFSYDFSLDKNPAQRFSASIVDPENRDGAFSEGRVSFAKSDLLKISTALGIAPEKIKTSNPADYYESKVVINVIKNKGGYFAFDSIKPYYGESVAVEDSSPTGETSAPDWSDIDAYTGRPNDA